MPHLTAELVALAEVPLFQSVAIGLMIAGAVILVWSVRTSLLEILQRALGGKAPREESARPVLRIDEPVRDEGMLPTVMADAEELVQLLAERIDQQASRLEQLIAAADERMAKLEKMMAEASRPTSRPAMKADVVDPLSRQIFELSDGGMPAVEIARQLNQQTGKVELILALRQHS